MDTNLSAFVFDSCAMIAYLENEEGADVVEEILISESNNCLAHAVNIMEVYKFYLKHNTASYANRNVKIIVEEMEIAPRRDLSEAFWKSVANIWATITTTKNPATKGCHHIAMADCFAIGLAKKADGTVITSDSQFKPVAESGMGKVLFYRMPGLRHDH